MHQSKHLVLHTFFSKPSAFRTFLLLIAFFSSRLNAQHTPCATAPPTSEVMAEVAAAMVSANSGLETSDPLTWNIPVRITVFQHDDGSGWLIPVDEAYFETFLSDMNAKLAGAPNTFNFFRCGPINYINATQLYFGTVQAEDYSYNSNFLNLYIYNESGQAPYASFPWDPVPNVVHLSFGTAHIANGTGFHELGHAIGLLHTFSPEVAYKVPVTPNQQDNPNNFGGRELMITIPEPPGSLKEFTTPNGSWAGDRVEDTPPGCELNATFWPSSATIAGCLDSDPNTPCANGCLDGNPNTPCLTGCAWDYNNCKYVGDYRDYNYDLLVDSTDVLVKNYMSYTGSCRQQFTPGQLKRANDISNLYFNDYYQSDLCGTLKDRVEIKNTNTGLGRVNLRITDKDVPQDYTQTIDDPQGNFSGKLLSQNLTRLVKADVKRFRRYAQSGIYDVTKNDNDWTSGLTAYDLSLISRHILGLDTLADGYDMLAADANKSNTITTFDIVLFRKLLLGTLDSLPAYTQPWRFIPEFVTHAPLDNSGVALREEFDGIGFDDPFIMSFPGTPISGTVAASTYCDPGWHFPMRSDRPHNGFDAVKLGNVNGDYSDVPLNVCPDEVVMLVPNTSLDQHDVVNLEMKGFDFQGVGAFQIGIKASTEDFEYISSESTNLPDYTEEESVGGLINGKGGLKFLWLSSDNTAKSLTNGASLFSVKLKAKKPISDLSQVLSLDKSVLETFFIAPDGSCVDNTSLQIGVSVADGFRGASEDRNGKKVMATGSETKIYCIPNPATDNAKVLFDASTAFDGKISIYDAYGKLLEEISQRFEPGRNIVTLSDFARLPVGVLNISIFDGAENYSVRVVKQ
jgi:hypothetical protein